jgi:hypothetical protein
MGQYKYYIIGGIVGLLILGLLINAYVGYEKALAVAEEKERSAKIITEQQAVLQKRFEEFIRAQQEQINALTAQQQALAQQAAARERQFASEVSQIKAVTNVDEIIKQMQAYLQVTATNAGNGNVQITAAQGQDFILLKLQNDKLQKDVNDLNAKFDLSEKKVKSLEDQLNASMKRLDDQIALTEQWQDAAKSYKVAAKKSKWQIFASYAKPIALGIITGIIAAEVSK